MFPCYNHGMDKKTYSRLTLDLPPDLHTKLKQLAAEKRISMKSLIMEWVNAGLTSNTPKK